MKVTVLEATSEQDMLRFVRYPNKLYRKNNYYVPQLVSGDLDTLDPQKNHAFEFCESKYWLAYDSYGAIVGRIAGIINHAYNKKSDTRYVRFGWLDFIDDYSVSEALFNTFEEWAKSKDAQYMDGPLGFLEFDAAGILIEGFDELPTAYGKYNAPYYAQHLERLGYVKEVDWVEYQVKVQNSDAERYAKMSKLLEERYNLTVRQFENKKSILRYADGIFEVMNQEYSNIHGYSELSKGQCDDLKKQFFPMLNLKYVVLVTDSQERVVGFGICLPSLSKALQKAKGRMFPFGFIHIMRALRKNDTLDTLLIAIRNGYRKKGVNALIFSSLSENIYKGNIKYLETTRELEDNHHVRNLWGKFDIRLHKRARCFIKKV